MTDAASYAARDTLRNGQVITIRASTASDEAGLKAALERTSTQSLYRRFFTVKRNFSDKERTFFLNVDFVRHVALVALVEEDGKPVIIGGGRYIVVEPGQAELAFAVIDAYQGQGVGKALFKHLAGLARSAGLKVLVAEVLRDNTPMLELFKRSGLPMTTALRDGVTHVTLALG